MQRLSSASGGRQTSPVLTGTLAYDDDDGDDDGDDDDGGENPCIRHHHCCFTSLFLNPFLK